MARLNNKVALITGAANGIGLATAQRFVAEGAAVLLVDINETELSSAAERLGASARYEVADVSQEAGAKRYVSSAIEAFGRVDVAVLNAGIEGGVSPIDATPLATFDRVMSVNVRGVWLGLASLLPLMKTTGGSIIVTSSVAGVRGRGLMGPYSASKHAVIGLAKTAALEAAKYGVRVNAICPAPTETRMMDAIDAAAQAGADVGSPKAGISGIPLGRYGTPDEIASLALFLASDEAAFITGAEYLIDGGATAGRPV